MFRRKSIKLTVLSDITCVTLLHNMRLYISGRGSLSVSRVPEGPSTPRVIDRETGVCKIRIRLAEGIQKMIDIIGVQGENGLDHEMNRWRD